MANPSPLTRLLSALGLQRKSQAIPLISGGGFSDPFALWSSSKKVSADYAMSLNTGWVYSGVRAIAEGISQIGFRLFKIKSDGTTEELFEHELLDLLDGVNPFQTGGELKYHTTSHLELVGNSYWYLEGVKNAKDKPLAIYLLNPKFVKIDKQPLPVFVGGYKYTAGSKEQFFKPYEILHFKYPDPNDPYEGMGTVQGILEWIVADNYATKLNENYFRNGARLSGVLESSSYTTPEQLDYIKKSFQQLYSGAANAYQVAAMPDGTKYTPMSDNPKDMDFANLQQVQRDKILSGFRVPKTILGAAESETNRATAETANYVFAARTLKPKMQMIVGYLNEFLVPRYGDDLYLDFTDPVPENRELEIQEMVAATGNSPVLSPNEARERYFSEKPVDNGDSLYAPFNLQPIGKVEKSATPQRTARKASGSGKVSTRYASNSKARKNMAEEIVKAAADFMKATEVKADVAKQKNFEDMTAQDIEALYKVFALRVSPYHKAIAKKVKTFNADQKKITTENLESAVKSFAAETKAIDKLKLFDLDEQVAAMIDLTIPLFTDLYAKEGVAAAELIGSTITEGDMLKPAIREVIERGVRLMSSKYNEATLDLLKAKLEQGIQQGASMGELRDLVSQVYEFSDETRAERVAETETFRIANEATKEAWKQTGVVQSMKWYTAEDERVCPWCSPMQGKTIGIDDDFFKKGDEVTGDNGEKMKLDYANVGAPPLHVSCRCWINPEEITLGGKPEKVKEPEPPQPSVDDLVKAALAEHMGTLKTELLETAKNQITEAVTGALKDAKVEITKEVSQQIASKIDEALS